MVAEEDGSGSINEPYITVIEAFKQSRYDKLESISHIPEYENSTLLDKFTQQLEENTFGGFLVAAFSDLDGTYIYIKKPTPEQLAELRIKKEKEYSESGEDSEILALSDATLSEEFLMVNRENTENLTSWLDSHHVPIIAVSGRNFDLITQGEPGGKNYSEERFPLFDAIISSVGTEISIRKKDGVYVKESTFDSYIRETVKYDRDEIYALSQKVIASVNEGHDRPILRFQDHDADPNEGQKQPYKISFNFNESGMTQDEIKRKFQEELTATGRDMINVVVSTDGPPVDGINRYCIDLVPVTKADAVSYLASKFCCLGVVSGDSGNDSDAILSAGEAGIMVGNRAPELDDHDRQLRNTVNSKRTRHFLYYDDESTARFPHLLFVDPHRDRLGPASELKALQSLNLLLRLMNTPDKIALMQRLN